MKNFVTTDNLILILIGLNAVSIFVGYWIGWVSAVNKMITQLEKWGGSEFVERFFKWAFNNSKHKGD